MLNIPSLVSTRLFVSGNHFELYHYEKPFYIGFPRLMPKCKPLIRVVRQVSIRVDNVARTRKKLRRLIDTNFGVGAKFLTLTYSDNQGDYSLAYRHFDIFIKRFKRFLSVDNFAFVSVVEFQSRGAVHFHLVANIPFVPASVLARLWGWGFVKINKIKNPHNLGAYVSKYLGKANFDKRFFGKKKYSTSKNLKQPLVLDNFEADQYLDFFISSNLEQRFSAVFDTRYCGVINYNYYLLKADTFYPRL